MSRYILKKKKNIKQLITLFRFVSLLSNRVLKTLLTWSIFWRDLSESPDNTDSNFPPVASDEMKVFVLVIAPLIIHWSSYFTLVSFAVETSHFRLKTLKSSVPFAMAFSLHTS
ncbi:hypothetical protein NP493_1334g00005 [Ridgeia piscesae]|uniref:Uncharacterized protein n=1 Tax=Ridgeia piscesae TaxID=27915 RepID=A0AAD9K807_RIDPI|nr:hypothetical protein NP493_1334g00005 [Ridgeia piscesae]